jgi:hypothetical protein
MKGSKVEFQKLLSSDASLIAEKIEDNNADADKHLRERLPTVKCECGAEILLLPDVQAMNCSIKVHVVEHRKKRRNAQSNLTASSDISQLLRQLSLIKINTETVSIFSMRKRIER